MTLLTNVPIPSTTRVAIDDGKNEGLMTQPWLDYFNNQVRVSSSTPVRLNSVSLTGKNASLSATDFSGGTLVAGLYRVEWFATITTAAATSSSLTVIIDFTYNGQAKTKSYTAITANTTGTFDHGGGLIEVDSSSPVRYSTTYASNGAGEMVYALDVVLEKINA